MKKIIKILLLVACIFFMFYFSYKIYNYLYEENAEEKVNEDLIDIAVTTKDTETNKIDENVQKKSIEVDFEVLKQKNNDIVGWLYSENTPINFPVVQSQDNDYYLRRLIDGTYNRAGTIFMDYRNNNDMSDWNTIIYGHNMKNNSMFGTLINYNNQTYYEEHKTMDYITEKSKYKIELIAGYTESADSEIYNVPANKETKNKILENAKSKSTFKSNIEAENEDRIITFSTCSYEFDGARYVLIGILKEI